MKNENIGVKRIENILEWSHTYLPFIFTIVFFIICVLIEWMEIRLPIEEREEIYIVFGAIVVNLSRLLNVFYGRKYGLNWISTIICTVIGLYLVFNLIPQLLMQIEVRISGTGSVAAYRSAIFLLPVCLLLAPLMKKNALDLCDYLTPYFFYAHGTVTIPCWIVGCCTGRLFSWGIYNPLTAQTVFPLQPCIILLSVGIAYWGIQYAKKYNYQAKGRIYAYSLIVYGFGRYLLEFVSDDMRILGVLSWNSFFSLAMVLLGSILSYQIYKKNNNNLEERS